MQLFIGCDELQAVYLTGTINAPDPKPAINIKTMIGGPGTTTPNYVKSANFTNSGKSDATLNVTFQSGHTENYTVAAGASQTVERSLEKGSHSEWDPISNVSSTVNGKSSNQAISDANGVESRNYNIADNGAFSTA